MTITAGSSTVRGLVINRFGGNGIEITSNGGNIIEGNFIGTDVTGSVALGNAFDGVPITGAPGNTIGGTLAGTRNVISGNTWSGVGISSGATGNLVQGNFIGTDVNGTTALGNGNHGIEIADAPNNTIGGAIAGAPNVISGNTWEGVRVGGLDATGNLVQGNFIGTDVTGTVDLGNSLRGVLIWQDGSSNTIGGVVSGESNTIAFNSGDGVGVHSGSGNSILSNTIFSNGGLGIELGNNGVTSNDPNDVDSGANNLQNFPELTAATPGSTIVDGTLNSTASTTFRLEFFSNAACDASGNGEGESFLGFSDQTTDGTGNVSFSVTFPDTVLPGQFITATATDPANNTSEFSACVQVVGPIIYTVNLKRYR